MESVKKKRPFKLLYKIIYINEHFVLVLICIVATCEFNNNKKQYN